MLKLHIINVGHGDCILIEFPSGRAALIDINKSDDMDQTTIKEIEDELGKNDSLFEIKKWLYKGNNFIKESGYKTELQHPIAYLSQNGIKGIFRFISTHPHMDHLSGLDELKSQHTLANLWIVKNEFTQDINKITDEQKKDWQFYKNMRDCDESKKDNYTIVRPLQGQNNDFWNEDGIEILAPNDAMLKLAKDKDNRNLMSYILLITYGKTKIILGGDAEKEIWEMLLKQYPDKLKNITILKASHHGRDSGYHQPSVKLMNPQYTIISVGNKPSTDAQHKYANYSNAYSTRWCGNIVFECLEDGTVTMDTQYEI